ncbi:hypothetical protein HMPREF0602_0058 [Neisseria meningitidis ATCC 13091]|uniref:Uncharacterized protein n=1 Tax=Neisseria meningitidis serogroup B (strain ATCC 13091 / M2091) TaxID=862513 RepID=E0N6C8_NEIM3|nr:hypothetical protein HMPREF0602_0058 [Neisseria meningitidis ATCC 13091]
MAVIHTPCQNKRLFCNRFTRRRFDAQVRTMPSERLSECEACP